MATKPFEVTKQHVKMPLISLVMWAVLGSVLSTFAGGCYNTNTGEANIGGAIHFKLPAFPETGSNAVQVFTEMHYQPSYRAQEVPRLLPPSDSVPLTGKELSYSTLNEYKTLTIPERVLEAYDSSEVQQLFVTNCSVCHGDDLRGAGPIVAFMTRGPFPADLTDNSTRSSTDGELFAFISGGGRQGVASALRNRESASPMPEFRLLLKEDERWALVAYLRSEIGK